MARKTKIVTIAAEGRDQGKSFLIREMPAMQAEKWGIRAILALGRAGAAVSEEDAQGGAMAALATLPFSILSSIRRMAFADAEPLLDEMIDCVSLVPDATKVVPGTDTPLTRPLMLSGDAADIEEIGTLLQLRTEAFELHTGFSLAAALSTLGSVAQRSSLSPTPTSQPSSAPQSAGA